MRCSSFAQLLVLCTLTIFASELPAENATQASIARQRFNQVFVKVIVPVTERTPKQDGPVVESWVVEQLKEMGESEYFAVTDWVPVCDGLLEDAEIDNRVWSGQLDGNKSGNFCPVGGDVPLREKGRVLVLVGGFTPVGGEASITLLDEPGSRAVEPVRLGAGKEVKRIEIEEGLPYVAVIIAPPPLPGATKHGDVE
ncbi:hypothetical protein [Stieleria varia]|uniref:Uncharacterized protein n=1 Tax=Stieleria varia TaxID=2528005 RepID=A0A5C6B0M5_9BACT|nr:hypothetical protein [Stieleria varia]TWU05855.1 hypothetical protein Pla52n_15700 [Stieleria varia]